MPGPEMLCVYQFKVVLRGISPMIWRRLLLRSDHTIADLHYAIQIAMGWTDAHLNRFHIHGKDYGVAHEGGLTFSDDPDGVSLAQFGFRLRERFLYEYDFYDGWQHDVRLEKVLPLNSKRLLPVCTGGQRLAPPEDCGGAMKALTNRQLCTTFIFLNRFSCPVISTSALPVICGNACANIRLTPILMRQNIVLGS